MNIVKVIVDNLPEMFDGCTEIKAEVEIMVTAKDEKKNLIFANKRSYDCPLKIEQNFYGLREENARLRDQLRWRDAKKEPPNKSDHYIVMTTLGMLALIYYNYTSTYGWSIPGIVSKWCYIPDDNQGTDCTPDDGDA